ncbi:MAG: GNAT family N-acetyltransferase [Bacteroidales bacterium]|nr:GNAT family N-acetyltransferase [Bacteroidales bacterium]MBQ9710757.1 GNAT family N-acetyltransferase [Bacteroidales bacterium]
MEILRATTLAHRAGAFYVRIQAMARQHGIPLEKEFDEHDGPDSDYIVVVDDFLPVATCRMYPLSESSVMIGRVVVLPEYRHSGLGKKVVDEAEKWAKEKGYRRAVLESREEIVGFYEQLGYKADYGRKVDGDTFVCVHMEKDLR